MSVQVLSAKSTRRLARQLGEPTITRAWVDNSVDHDVVFYGTWDHVHGSYDRFTGEHTVLSQTGGDGRAHAPSCFDADGRLLLELDPFTDDGHWPTLRD